MHVASLEGEWCLYSADGMYCIITLAPHPAMPYWYRTVMLLACLNSRTGALPYWLCGIYRYSPIAPMRTVPVPVPVRYEKIKYSYRAAGKYGTCAMLVPPLPGRAGQGAVPAGTDYLNTNSMPAALPVLVGLSLHMPLRYTQRVRVYE